MNQGLPLVSIVTPSYNKGSFIEETILSVKNQAYHHIEHIVVDGGSTDETLDILRKYSDSITWVSEPDEGQSDAINKGWRMSKGGILAYLNADDTYMPEAVQTAVEFLSDNPDVGMVFGDADFTDEHGEVTGHYQTCEFDLKKMLCSHNHVPQPTVFFRREVLDKVGYLDNDLHLAMDLDYWIRISLKFRIRHVDQTLATMRLYPGSKFVAQYYEAVYEHLHILDKFYSNRELAEEIRSFKRRAHGAVHLRASIDYLRTHYKGKALSHMMKALILHPQCLKNIGTLVHLARLLLGEKSYETTIWFLRKAELFIILRTMHAAWVRSLFKLTRQQRIKRYFDSHQIRKLQIGSGGNILAGWLNTDINPSKGPVFLDATKPFPFDDCTFDYIYCEHLIEHLEYQKGIDLLCECVRILRAGGKIRIATPDLRFLIELYGSEKTELQDRYICWAVDSFLSNIGIHQDVFVINNFFRDWGHRFIYDFKALRDAMSKAGLTNIARYNVRQSDDKNFQGVESHGKYITDEFNSLETLAVEGQKPD